MQKNGGVNMNLDEIVWNVETTYIHFNNVNPLEKYRFLKDLDSDKLFYVSDYSGEFLKGLNDNHNCLILDKYDGQLKIQVLCCILDRFFFGDMGCDITYKPEKFNIYILSDKPLTSLYPGLELPKLGALCRRINKVIVVDKNKTIKYDNPRVV